MYNISTWFVHAIPRAVYCLPAVTAASGLITLHAIAIWAGRLFKIFFLFLFKLGSVVTRRYRFSVVYTLVLGTVTAERGTIMLYRFETRLWYTSWYATVCRTSRPMLTIYYYIPHWSGP